MASSATKGLAFCAALFGGLQAGVTANRAFVLLPAWERLGVVAWANFTRVENVGIGGLFYPVLGLAALLFTASAAIAFRMDRTARGLPGFPVYAAVLLGIAWAAVTRAFILPPMFALRDAGSNTVQLQQIFLTVSRWSGVNDLLHVLTFGLNLWALGVIFSSLKNN
jgi:hypothetical protein